MFFNTIEADTLVWKGRHVGLAGQTRWSSRADTLVRQGRHVGLVGQTRWSSRADTLVRQGKRVGQVGQTRWSALTIFGRHLFGTFASVQGMP